VRICLIQVNVVREINAEISKFQKIVADRDHDITQLDRTIRGLRGELRAAQAAAKEASTSKDRAVSEAENLRETLAEQQPDSGRIIAFQAAIEV
jgi:chromosome segregation ATPase